MKKAISLILALAMSMSLTVSAFAVDQTVTANGENSVTKDAQVDLKGEVIKGAVLMSVVMPTSVDFTVATKAATTTTVAEKNIANASQIAMAGSYVFADLYSPQATVTNNSNVAIKLEITNVEDNGGLLKKMDLGVTSTDLDKAAALATPLEARDYTSSAITLANSITEKGGTATLEVVGQGAQGQFSGQSWDVDLQAANYTVTTTMKISVA